MINFLALLLAAPAPSDDRCADLVAKYNDYTPYELCPSEQVANGADPAATLAFASECYSLLPARRRARAAAPLEDGLLAGEQAGIAHRLHLPEALPSEATRGLDRGRAPIFASLSALAS